MKTRGVYLVDLSNPSQAFDHCLRKIERTDGEAEKSIIKNPVLAARYAHLLRKGRWEEAEPIILTSVDATLYYVLNVIGGPWGAAEDVLKRDSLAAVTYATRILKGRFIAAERYIAADPSAAMIYTIRIIKGLWALGEPAIMSCNYTRVQYRNTFMNRSKGASR